MAEIQEVPTWRSPDVLDRRPALRWWSLMAAVSLALLLLGGHALINRVTSTSGSGVDVTDDRVQWVVLGAAAPGPALVVPEGMAPAEPPVAETLPAVRAN